MPTLNRPTPAVFCWSGGKDSAYALRVVRDSGELDIRFLLTTVNGVHGRVSMHGVREALLDAQADALGIPLLKVRVTEPTLAHYEERMGATLATLRHAGVRDCVFGDIFLEDLRRHREEKLAAVGMRARFPLWRRDTAALARDFIAEGFRTVTCCVNDAKLTRDHVGRDYDAAFLASLPADVDPCGENGEFHTFCHAGPVFRRPVAHTLGEIVYRPLEIRNDDSGVCVPASATRGFWYADLLPA